MKKDRAAPEPWRIEFYRRPADLDPGGTVPAEAELLTWPREVVARVTAVLQCVAAAPPPAFSGGGLWEAMHEPLTGFYEVRVDHRRTHYRVFCLLERNGSSVGLSGPSIIVLCAATKPVRTVLSKKDYRRVLDLGTEYRLRLPRSVKD